MSGPTSYRVEWADVARRDLDEISAFISKDSLTAALRLADRIEDRAAALESMPRRGRVPPELERFGLQIYRELLITPFRLVYRIYEDKVVVLGVFDGRRNLEDVILGRLLSM